MNRSRIGALALVLTACSASSGGGPDAGDAPHTGPLDAQVRDAADSPADVRPRDGGKDAGKDGPTDAPADAFAGHEEFDLIFSGSLATSAPCGGHLSGTSCDIYSAILRPSDGTVRDVKRLTVDPRNEQLPALSGNGSVVYFNVLEKDSAVGVGYVDRGTLATGELSRTFVALDVMPDGKGVVYTSLPDRKLMRAGLANSGTSIIGPEELAAEGKRGEPKINPAGTAIVFQQLSTGETGSAQAMLMLLDTREVVPVSAADGTGHCGWNWSGSAVVCDNKVKGNLMAWPIQGNKVGTGAPLLDEPSAAELAALDADFQGCSTSVNFPAFCGSDTTLLASVSCSKRVDGGMETTFQKLVLMEFGGPSVRLYPLGKAVAEAFGGEGISSWMGRCRALGLVGRSSSPAPKKRGFLGSPPSGFRGPDPERGVR